MWRHGDNLYAEAELTGRPDDGFRIHPALLDAALHPALLDGALHLDLEHSGEPEGSLPSAWNGADLYPTDAREIRVLLTAAGPQEIAVQVADPHGRPIAVLGSLALRPVSLAVRPVSTASATIYEPSWIRCPVPPGPAPETATWAAIGNDEFAVSTGLRRFASMAQLKAADHVPGVVFAALDTSTGRDQPAKVRAACENVLALMLAVPPGTHLVVVTRHAVSVRNADTDADADAEPTRTRSAIWPAPRSWAWSGAPRVSIPASSPCWT